MNYFQGNSNHPRHLSVGAVLVNDTNEVCVHHFTGEEKGYWIDEGLKDFYILMRKTVSPNESLEETLRRGIMEEFGAEAEIKNYIGSIQSHFMHQGVQIEKTTIYFLCSLISQDLNKRDKEFVEGQTQIEWHAPDFLIPKMKEQAKRYNRTDVDESGILERLK